MGSGEGAAPPPQHFLLSFNAVLINKVYLCSSMVLNRSRNLQPSLALMG